MEVVYVPLKSYRSDDNRIMFRVVENGVNDVIKEFQRRTKPGSRESRTGIVSSV